jgi:hypothetical protein
MNKSGVPIHMRVLERQPKAFLTSSFMITMGSSASSTDVKAGSEYAALQGMISSFFLGID